MQISHVIRGEEHLSNTPKQILIAQALSFSPPIFAHLPLILNEERSKLSKRTGSVPLREYRKAGYLPEAILNFLAFLGWNPGTEKEIYSLAQLINDFSLERVKKSNAIFYQKRLDFLNGFYIRQKDPLVLTEMVIPLLIEKNFIQPIFQTQQTIPGVTASNFALSYLIVKTKEIVNLETIQKIVSLYQTRIIKLSDFCEMANFFFEREINLSFDLLKWKDISLNQLKKLFERIKNLLLNIPKEQWKKDDLFNILLKESDIFLQEINKKDDRGYFFWPLRVSLTGKKFSAPPVEIMEILGKEKTIQRIEKALRFLTTNNNLKK
ncbi:MAG: glutamate--tRNA ligase, partial [Minisyncoccales bacterium]